MAVSDFDQARRTLKDRLDASERRIEALENVVATQRTLLSAHDEIFQLWLGAGAAFRTIGADIREKDLRLAAVEAAVEEIRTARCGVGSPATG